MDQQSLPEKDESRPLQTDGSKITNTQVSHSNNTSDSQSAQGQEIDALMSVICEIEDERVYLLCDRVQKVRGGYRVNIMDIADVRRVK